MTQTNTYNVRAAGEALKLLGGDELVSKFAWLYDALDRAERQGWDDGYGAGEDYNSAGAFDEGYDDGYADGHADGIEMFIDDNNVKENAQVEGQEAGPSDGAIYAAISNRDADLHKQDAPDWEVVKAVAALDDSTPF